MEWWKKNPFYVKDCGMVGKKEGKENEKCSTLFVKLSGMRKKEGIREEGKRLEKERGKEDKKYRVNTKGCGIG